MKKLLKSSPPSAPISRQMPILNFSKDSSKEQSKKSPRNATKTKSSLFEGKRAAFVVFGKELTQKRCEILQNSLREHGGKVLNLDSRKSSLF